MTFNKGIIDKQEFAVLLYALLRAVSQCANTTATQSSFLKYASPRALKSLQLRLPTITPSEQTHQIHCSDSLTLINQLPELDILYCDPPYNCMQYANAYHLFETIARWDEPGIHGISGIRNQSQCCSSFSLRRQALTSLTQLVASRCYRHLLLSYSDDGIIAHRDILALLQQYGDVVVKEHRLKRYNCMSHHDPRYNPRKDVVEHLYYLRPHTYRATRHHEQPSLKLTLPPQQPNVANGIVRCS